MLFFIAFSLMFISSVTVILYVDHFSALNKKKEMKKLASQKKFQEQLQMVNTQEDDKQVLLKAI